MQDASSKQLTKQKYKPNHQQTELSPRSALPIRGKTNTQHKSHPTQAYTKHWINPRGAVTKSKKEFNLLQRKNSAFLEAWEKETSNTVSYFKKMKRQRNTTQMKEQTRNTEVQINEELIDKTPEKEFKIMIVKMIKKKP